MLYLPSIIADRARYLVASKGRPGVLLRGGGIGTRESAGEYQGRSAYDIFVEFVTPNVFSKTTKVE